MARKQITVAIAFSSDPMHAEHVADKNFDLAVRHDPSINNQQVLFDSWSYIDKKTGLQMFGAKYFYWGVNDSPVVENHPSIKGAAA